MHTSMDLLELAKTRLAVKHNLPLPMTDYRLHKLLGLKQQTVSQWRKRERIGGEFTHLIAEACELPDTYVYACLEHERAGPEVRGILERIAEGARDHAAVILIAALFCVGIAKTPTAQASNAHSSAAFLVAKNIPYAKYLRRLPRGARSAPLVLKREHLILNPSPTRMYTRSSKVRKPKARQCSTGIRRRWSPSGAKSA